MTWLGPFLLRSAAALACAGFLTACGSEEEPKECKARAAFDLEVRAASGALPSDTSVLVEYGGGQEEYRLDDPVHQQEDVLCTTEPADAGAVMTLRCALWTQGAATVTVRASGYPELQEELEAQADGKCIETVPVVLTLGDVDAGT